MKSTQAGFSLIELMCVIGIIGMLASLSMSTMNGFRAKAMAAEATGNLNYLNSLMRSWEIENGDIAWSYMNLPGCPQPQSWTCAFNWQTSSNGWYQLTNETVGDPSDCNIPNEIGFTLSDCSRARYAYAWVEGIGGFGTIYPETGHPLGGILAVERFTVLPFNLSDTVQEQNRMLYPGCKALNKYGKLAVDVWSIPASGAYGPGNKVWSDPSNEQLMGQITHNQDPSANGCE